MKWFLLSLTIALSPIAYATSQQRWSVVTSGPRHVDWVISHEQRAHFEDCLEDDCVMLGRSLSRSEAREFLTDFRDHLVNTSSLESLTAARQDRLIGRDTNARVLKRFLVSGASWGAIWSGSQLLVSRPAALGVAGAGSILSAAIYYLMSEQPLLEQEKRAAAALLPFVSELRRAKASRAPQPVEVAMKSYDFLVKALAQTLRPL